MPEPEPEPEPEPTPVPEPTALPVPTATPAPVRELPPLAVPVTRTLIVAGALASRDFQDVHHDPEAARAKGSPDIFMNILTTNGLVGRYVTDHLGPRARLRKVAIRLGAPCHPGDTLTLTGTVTAVHADGTTEVRVVGDTSRGRHVTATATAAVTATTATATATAVLAATEEP
ncbi:MaoC family dehydratase [Streptomyces sp. TRM49041]|uniref:MaoC family dehydratase n=1 Tax=Streptomyces sp. TRM49041 TaxID=2603216 RepID=UPI0011EC033C|nr:MaoC family dehydratase [Streptomyces sp. TRM49041]